MIPAFFPLFFFFGWVFLCNLMFSFPFYLALSFLISNLNPQQERAPHYPYRKIRAPYYCPTKKSSRGIFIRMKPPKRLKPHCEITMAQKRCQQGCKLITGSVTLKKATLEMDWRKHSTVRLPSCDKVTKVETKLPSHGHPLRKHLSNTAETSLSCHMGHPERCLQAFINTVLFWPCPLHSLNVCGKNGRKRLLAAWNAGPVHAVTAKCCCLFHMEINAAECSQLPNKWLWLLLLHTKQWKTKRALAIAWEQKGGINGVRNKALVWLELRNIQHDFLVHARVKRTIN